MLDLTQNIKFKNDIESNHTSIYPVVVIKSKNTSLHENIYISTIKEVIKVEETGEVVEFKDYALKINSINESIDLKSRNFKISNLTINLSDYSSEGNLSNSLLNYAGGEVQVYLKSQSCRVFEDLILVYTGVFYDFKLNINTVRIVLEDLTEAVLNTEVPIANLGFADDAFSLKYKDVPIPIAYGSIEKAPSVIFKSADNINKYHIISDNVLSQDSPIDINSIGITGLDILTVNSFNETYSPLYLYKDNYFNVLPDINQDIVPEAGGYGFELVDQFTVDYSSVIIQKRFYIDYPNNPPANNMLQCVRVAIPNEAVNFASVNSEQILYDQSTPANSMKIYDDSPFLALEASIDTPDSVNKFLIKSEESNYLTSHAILPDNELAGIFLSEDGFEIAGLRGYNYAHPSSYEGVFYPRQFGSSGYAMNYTRFHWFITAWCLAHSSSNELQSRDVSYINQPIPVNVFNRANQYLIDNGFNSNPNPSFSDLFISNNIEGQARPNAYTKQPFISGALFDAYWEYNFSRWIMQAEQGYDQSWIDEYDSTDIFQRFQAFGTYHDPDDPLDPGAEVYYERTKHASYPSYLYRLRLKTSGDENVSWQTSYNTNNIQYLYIGQWASIAQTDSSWLDDGGSGLFLNIYDDGSGKPYLFEQPGTINPTIREVNGYTSFGASSQFEDPAGNTVSSSPFLQASYRAEVLGGASTLTEGVGGNTQGQTQNIFGSLQGTIETYTYYGTGTPTQGSLNYNDSSDGYYGGVNPFHGISLSSSTSYRTTAAMFFPQGLPAGIACTFDGHGTDGRMAIDPSSKCEILPYTIMPYMARVPNGGYGFSPGQRNVSGYETEYAYYVPESTIELAIDSGTTESDFGETVIISYPFDNLGADDAFDTITYAFGKIICDFNQNEKVSDVNDSSYFNLILSATDINTIDVDGVDIFTGAQFAYLPGLSLNLFEQSTYTTNSGFKYGIQGGESSILNQTSSRMWSSIDNLDNEENLFTSEGSDPSKYWFPSWSSPDSFNALTLHYSLNRDNTYTEETSTLYLNSKIHSIGLMQYILFENVFDSDFYVDINGRANNPNDFYVDANGSERYKYTNDILGNDYPLISNPMDIIYHFLEKELKAYNVVDIDNWSNVREYSNISHAFSVKNKIQAKLLMQDIASNSTFFPVYRGNNNKFSFVPIKSGYDSHDQLVESKDVQDFKISTTLNTDIYTLVNVKYKKDYATDKYQKETGYCDGYDFFGNGDGIIASSVVDTWIGTQEFDDITGYEDGYKYKSYGLERDSNVLEFESDFIRDEASAIALRNFLYLQNCNVHVVIEMDLPLKYFNLETGDIIRFNEVLGNLKILNEDYTEPYTRNGQTILPYFMVTSTKKSIKKVKVKCIQMHSLTSNITHYTGSLSRAYFQKADGENFGQLNYEDFNILEKYLNNEYQYITSQQKKLADIGGYPNIIGTGDLLALSNILNASWWSEYYESQDDESDLDELITNGTMGDFNQSGYVTIVDIVMLIQYIQDGYEPDSTQYAIIQELGDINEDGTVNIFDLIIIMEYILEGGEI